MRANFKQQIVSIMLKLVNYNNMHACEFLGESQAPRCVYSLLTR